MNWRAFSDTAMRPDTFSMAVFTGSDSDDSARERSMAVCCVATGGPLATQQASTDTVGEEASCTWTTSKSPS